MALLRRWMKWAAAFMSRQLAEIVSILRGAGRMAVNAILPPRCLACGDTVNDGGALCPACFAHFTFITPPCCRVCGLSLESIGSEDLICGGCIQDRPAFNRARAVFVYDEYSKFLPLKLKHGDRTDAAVHLARWMKRAGAESDLIVPVPLHRWRLLWRTYNQAALLSNALGRLAGKPAVPNVLVRDKATPSQGRRGHAARYPKRPRSVLGATAETDRRQARPVD